MKSLMKPKLLLAIPQMPQDPASGAARTAQTACEMAAAAGWEVRAIGPTATERGTSADALSWLRSLGLEIQVAPASGKHGRRFLFSQRGISHTLLDTGDCSSRDWEPLHGEAFDHLFYSEIAVFRPDVVLSYGGYTAHMRRLRHARSAGSRIAFCVFNMAYLIPGFFTGMDAVLTPGEWLAKRYQDAIGLRSTPLPTPVEFSDVLATEREPVFLTMVNPSVEKGLFFFARLAEEIGRLHPGIPMLTIEARGTAGMLCEAGRLGGFDLRRHENLMFAPSTPNPRDFFQPTRLLLVPSVCEEASGRVVAEALVNGVPPLVSDRGGLAESCNGAGFVLPLPADLTQETRVPVGAEAVRAWIDVIVRLFEDEAFFAAEAAKAREAAAMYDREALAPRYVRFFESVLARG